MSTQENIQVAVYGVRGRILQRAVEIESLLDIYIAEHFTKDDTKVNELITLLLAPRITFENKFQIFKYIVEIYHPWFKKNNPAFSKDLTHIVQERNVFAHYPVDFSKQAFADYENNAVITFVKLRNSSEIRHVTEQYVNDLISLMLKYAKELRNLVGGFDTAPPPA